MLVTIIVNYKSNFRTIRYVKEELCKVSIEQKIVIVNNGASPESDEELANALGAHVVTSEQGLGNHANIYLISDPNNSGFAKGNNIGARFAIDVLEADYLLFTNNDIKFLNIDVVEQLISKFEVLQGVGIIGPKVIGLDGKFQSPEPYVSFWDRNVWMFLSTPFYSKAGKRKRFMLDYSQNAKEGFHYKLMGSFFIVKSVDFVKCGMFDEHTFLYAEEPILTERMKRIGLRPYYYPQVSVLHDHGATTKKHFKGNKLGDIQFNSECYYYKTYCHTPLIQILIGKVVRFLYKIFKC